GVEGQRTIDGHRTDGIAGRYDGTGGRRQPADAARTAQHAAAIDRDRGRGAAVHHHHAAVHGNGTGGTAGSAQGQRTAAVLDQRAVAADLAGEGRAAVVTADGHRAAAV